MKLTIVIPVYNGVNFLERTFRDLEALYQFLPKKDFEIIFVNDGSTDNSGEVLNDFGARKSNIKVIHQHNLGLSGARNTGIDHARGKFIQFLDADDTINFSILIHLLTNADHLNIDALCYGMKLVDESGNLIRMKDRHSVQYDKVLKGSEALIKGYQISSVCCFLIRTNFLKEKNLKFVLGITHEDVEFTNRLMINAQKVIFKEDYAYNYLQHSGSMSKPTDMKKLEKLLHDEIIVAKLIKDTIQYNMDPKLKTAIIKNYNSVVWNLLWRFYSKQENLNESFIKRCFEELKKYDLYPIKGSLKTIAQKTRKYMINYEKYFIDKIVNIQKTK